MGKISEQYFLGGFNSKTLILYHKIVKILQKFSEFYENFEKFFFYPELLKMVKDDQKSPKLGDFSGKNAPCCMPPYLETLCIGGVDLPKYS